ncbi:MAG TPA: phasin family protein [Methylocella sp.]|nr:phasin family protein [Methylocella sp.]
MAQQGSSDRQDANPSGQTDTSGSSSENIQAIATQVLDASRQSVENITKTLDRLRQARGMDEVITIQTDFVREVFQQAAGNTQKFSQMLITLPLEMTKSLREAWLTSLKSTLKTTDKATQAVDENLERMSEPARRASGAFEHRETA